MANERKLQVLEMSLELFVEVDEVAAKIRTPRHFEISRQLIKSPLSIGSNIAEGREKDGQVEFLRFLNMSLGSAGELAFQIRAGKAVAAITDTDASRITIKTDSIRRMIRGLRRRIQSDLKK